MRFSSAVFFAGNALALAKHECLVNNNEDLAAFADCGHERAISYCLGQLMSFEPADVEACYTKAGCSIAEAEIEAKYTLGRCEEMNKIGDLKKRYRGMLLPRADATTTDAAAKTTAKSSNKFGAMTGTDCFTTGKKSTTECPLSTSDGHVKTVTCFPTEVSTSECAPGLLCTVDTSNNDVCMDLQSSLETSGIVILIVFGIIIALGIGSLTFMCCKESKDQKRLTAKAEAVALARAATKKQRAQDRAPLIRNASGGSNPFQDQPRI
ncbi:Fc.00g071050.m01.CDS01 [Cosmosporella sp. VM-42]